MFENRCGEVMVIASNLQSVNLGSVTLSTHTKCYILIYVVDRQVARSRSLPVAGALHDGRLQTEHQFIRKKKKTRVKLH